MEISRAMLEALARQAERSPRGRQHLLLHHGPGAPAQKLLSVMTRRSYVQPHRHSIDRKEECLTALRGSFGCVIFDDEGAILRSLRFGIGEDLLLVHIAPDEWHSLVALGEGGILFEIKDGPHDPATAKDMADWAPGEGSAAAPTYLAWMHSLFA